MTTQVVEIKHKPPVSGVSTTPSRNYTRSYIMSVPLMAIDLITQLDEDHPARNPRATDFITKAAEASMLMYAGKRELIELLLDRLDESTESLPVMNKKE
jgi:hypothetical protein